MPVLSLPEYLGIQEAPQQPVFQRTRQLAQPRSPWERDVQIADAMTQLRQQQPLSQIQAVQNEYDNIMLNAEKIRREREAASQAERAVSALAGLTPESDDYLNQRRQIMTQFPSAVLDPRVQSIMDDSDRMFNARQSSAARMEQERLAAEAARADEIQKRATSLIEMGESPDQARKIAVDPYAAAQAKYQRGIKPQGSRYEKPLDVIQSMIKAVPEDERYDYKDGERTVRPGFQALLERQKKLADAYFGELEGREPVAADKTATAVIPTMQRVQIPFRPSAAGAEAAPPVIPTPTPKGVAQQTIGGLSPEAILRIQNAPASELNQAIEREERLADEERKINEEWTRAKSDIEQKLKTLYPDKPNKYGINPLELFATQVFNRKNVLDPEIKLGGGAPVPGGFVSPEIPIQVKALRDLGIKPSDAAFTESGQKRLNLLGLIGSQDVTYDDLIRDWARRFLESRKLINVPLSEKQSIAPEERNTGVNLLNKYVPPSNG